MPAHPPDGAHSRATVTREFDAQSRDHGERTLLLSAGHRARARNRAAAVASENSILRRPLLQAVLRGVRGVVRRAPAAPSRYPASSRTCRNEPALSVSARGRRLERFERLINVQRTTMSWARRHRPPRAKWALPSALERDPDWYTIVIGSSGWSPWPTPSLVERDHGGRDAGHAAAGRVVLVMQRWFIKGVIEPRSDAEPIHGIGRS